MIKILRSTIRRHRLILRLFVFTSLISYVLLKYFEEAKDPLQQPALALDSRDEQYAYASLLCDDVMIDAVKVLVYSLRATGTKWPFVLLVLPQVRQTDDLIRLGAKLEWIDPLEYPFKVNQEKAAINKMCRYSKLKIWKMTQYKKIVFIDVDCLIVQKLDAAFRWPEFSAVRDAGDTFNTGLFVMEPSLETYRRMSEQYMLAPSYNQGDQGFLNWYYRNAAKMALPVKYNTVCKHKVRASRPHLLLDARNMAAAKDPDKDDPLHERDKAVELFRRRAQVLAPEL